MNRTKSNGGALPHLTGNLMRSQVVTNGVVPDVSEGPFAGGDPGAAIATLEMGDTAYIGYQAKYAA
ncbi:MAG: hypothetical protein U5N55_10740, partial [Cypionkella sp.]|nr:hypothetical protein [Cypionkella sp.]